LRGTAFYRARTAVEECQKRAGLLRVNITDGVNQIDQILNTLLLATETIEDFWTKKQKLVANYLRLHPTLTYEQIGQEFGISKSSISQILSAAKWEALLEIEKLIFELSNNT
jgi:hypothetical protein